MVYMPEDERNELHAQLENLYDQVFEEWYPQTKAEIIDYYQEEYGNKWKRNLVQDLARFTGKKVKNLSRRFDPSRRNNPEKRNAKQYQAFGKTLKPRHKEKLKGKRIRIEVDATLVISAKKVTRTMKIHISPAEVKELIRTGIDGIIERYGIVPEEVEEATIHSFRYFIE